MRKMKIEAIVGCPPERELTVVQLFAENGWLFSKSEQWGEIQQEQGVLLLEVYPRANRKEWVFSCHELQQVIGRSKERLIGSSTSDTVAKNWIEVAWADDGTMSVLSDNECCAYFVKQGEEFLICFPSPTGEVPWVFLLHDIEELIDDVRKRFSH